jgi:uncharacterized protein (DUF2336 family)
MGTSARRSIEEGCAPVSTVQASLIDELEAAMKSGSSENRVNTLRRITDLFLHDADRLNDDQIRVFDDVLCRLTVKIEKTARMELAKRLAPIDAAPVEVVRRLARDDEVDVAWPVLTESKRLTDHDLLEIVQTKSQAHLLAISGRAQLQPPVTDALLDRGNREVVSKLATNAGAHFSEPGFDSLVQKTEGDDELALVVGLRNDIPLGYLRDLLRRATEAVRQRLLALVPPQKREELKELIAKVADTIGGTARQDFSAAEVYVRSLEASGKLNEIVVLNSVIKGRREVMIAAMARLCATPIRTMSDLLSGQRSDMVLIPCKAADLSWPTVDAVLRYRLPGQTVSDAIIARARADYAKLTRATAQRTLRFMQVREAVA